MDDITLTASRVLVSNSSGKLSVSSITSTILGYLSGLTSNVQTQINNKVTKTAIQRKLFSATWTLNAGIKYDFSLTIGLSGYRPIGIVIFKKNLFLHGLMIQVQWIQVTL